MGMVLEHELTASYAAGSLGGTLGRLQTALKRLCRIRPQSRRQRQEAMSPRGPQALELAALNQTLRSVADAWACMKTPSRRFSQVDDVLAALKENALSALTKDADSRRIDSWPEYQLLAQAIDKLRSVDHQHI